MNDKYNIPKGYSTARIILRSLRYFRRNSIRAIAMNMDKFGDTYSVVFPGGRLVIITQEAAFIQYVLRDNHTNYQKSKFSAEKVGRMFGNGLLVSNGNDWLRQRRLIQPGFHAKKLQELYANMVATIEKSLAAFPTGEQVDVYPPVYQVAFNVILRSLFDFELSAKTMKELVWLFNKMQDFVVKDINRPLRPLTYFITRQDKINLRRSARMRDIIQDIITQRKKDPAEYNDLLDMLLKARYEDTGEPMSGDQIINEVLVLMLAGHETTANTLSWLLSLVAGRQDVLERLRTLAETIPVYDSARNDYFIAVINEAMRLRPAAFMTDRMALTDDACGQWVYPKGTVVLSFFYGVHHHQDHWQNGEAFMPERFLDESGKLKKMPAFYPFGAGPRLCIGNNFAIAEMCFFLHIFFRRFTIAPTGHTPVLVPLITLRPDKVLLNVQRVISKYPV